MGKLAKPSAPPPPPPAWESRVSANIRNRCNAGYTRDISKMKSTEEWKARYHAIACGASIEDINNAIRLADKVIEYSIASPYTLNECCEMVISALYGCRYMKKQKKTSRLKIQWQKFRLWIISEFGV